MNFHARAGLAALAVFIASIPLANWLIGNAGTVCVPDGPCLVPVWPGLMAPSGVVVVGVALCARDVVQRTLGLSWALYAVAAGALLSAAVAPPALVIASAAAFLFAHLLDTAVYTPLYRRRLLLAVALSTLVGIVGDSALFLWLAFGSLEFLAGQVVGKLWGGLAALVLIAAMRRRLEATA